VGHRAEASLDNVEKRKFLILPGLELRPLSRPTRSQALYRLRYPGVRILKKQDARVWLLVQNRDNWWSLLNTTVKFRVP
jgi:hypothetical protein